MILNPAGKNSARLAKSMLIGGVLLAFSTVKVHAQNTGGEPLYGGMSLASGFEADPLVINMLPGGGNTADHLGDECLGFINADQPDYRLNYAAGATTLGILVEADADTTLLVSDPRGVWHCSDNSAFLSAGNPGIVFNTPIDGEYNIWVGVYDFSETDDAVALVITEKDQEVWSDLDIVSNEFDIFTSMTGNSDGINFGDNQSSWSNDGECDDPRFSGVGMAVTANQIDLLHDAEDCWALYEVGDIQLIGGPSNIFYPQGVGKILRGILDDNDFSLSNGSFVDTVDFVGRQGESLILELRSGTFNPMIFLRAEDSDEVEAASQSSSAMQLLNSYILPSNSKYEIWVSSEKPGETGAYTLTIESIR